MSLRNTNPAFTPHSTFAPYWVEQSYTGYPTGGDTQSIVATFDDEGEAEKFATALRQNAPRDVRIIARKADDLRHNPSADDFTLLTTWDLFAGPSFNPPGFHLEQSLGQHVPSYPEFTPSNTDMVRRVQEAPNRVILRVNDGVLPGDASFTLDEAPEVFSGLATMEKLLMVGNVYVITDRSEHLVDMTGVLDTITAALRSKNNN